MKKFLGAIILLFFVFYYFFPQAISFFGFSFIFTSAALGLGLYVFNGFPFPEIIRIGLAYIPFALMCIFTGYIHNFTDPYLFDNTKSQVAWIFSAYLIIYIFFQVHPNGSFTTLLYYMIAVILIQCVIAVAMYMNPAVNSFFGSLQMIDSIKQAKMEDTEDQRLLGYGIAFFGAGIAAGSGLIFTAYVVMKNKYNLFMLIIWGVIYVAILYIGLLMARTTMIGMSASIILILILLFLGKNKGRSQLIKFLAAVAIFASIGYTLCYVYFPEFSDWAFEAFINYSESGEIRTQSSDGIENMFILPSNSNEWLYGKGWMTFWGSDVGYTRLLFYVGLPGTIAFFYYQFSLAKMAFTKDRGQSAFLLILIASVLALNVKGLADLNMFMYLFVFYFLHYRYYIYTPQLYRLGKFNSTKLRYAVQGEKARRGI